MEIKVSESSVKIPVLRVVGEIDLHTCPQLRSALQSLTEAGKFRIILDMSGVPYVDSAALGVLVDTQRRVKEKDGELLLAGITSFVMRAFEITRLIRIFRVSSTAEDALEMAEGDTN